MGLGGFIAGMFLLVLVFVAIIIALFVFWIRMIVDCVKRDFKSNEKVVWILVLILLGFLGAGIYYFVVKAGKKKIQSKKS